MSDIIGGIVAVVANLLMLFLVWRFGFMGLWNAMHRVTYRGWSRLAHGRPARKVDYAYIERTERELGWK